MIKWLRVQYADLTSRQKEGVRFGLGIMVVIAFMMLMAQCSTANASSFMAKDTEGNTITVTDSPCSIQSSWFKKWHAGEMVYKGRVIQICWSLVGTTVVILDSDGEVTPVPVRVFHNAVEAKAG